MIEKCIIEFHFEIKPLLRGFAIGEIYIKEYEISKIRGYDSTLSIELCLSKFISYFKRLLFGVQAYSTISFFLCGGKICFISIHMPQSGR